MKGWTVEALEAKGVKYSITGGANAPAKASRPKKAGVKRQRLIAPRSRPAVDEIVVELSVPPTANHCWVNIPGAGRVRSSEYRRWHKDAAREASLVRGRIDGAYTTLIELGPLPHGSDVDNRQKPTLDMLAGLLTDDDVLCDDARSKRSDTVPARRMRVTLRKAA